MKTKAKLISLVFTLIVIISGCTKEGPEGPAGKDGINGKDGNANVVSATITSSAWVYNTPSWVISFSYPAITQDIINNGAVLVYIKVGNGYNQLPLTFYQSQNYSTSIEVSTYVGGLTLLWTDSDLTQPINPGENTFKIVVISASGLNRNPNINFNNYLEVKHSFNLPD
jgi:hypothetical protein